MCYLHNQQHKLTLNMEALDIPVFKIENNTATDAKAFQTCSKSDAVPILLNSALNSAEIGALLEDDLIISEVTTEPKNEDLTTKTAISFLISGTLTSNVCRYCLEVTKELNSLEKMVEIGSKGGFFSVTVKDMVASFHPFQVSLEKSACDFDDDLCGPAGEEPHRRLREEFTQLDPS